MVTKFNTHRINNAHGAAEVRTPWTAMSNFTYTEAKITP